MATKDWKKWKATKNKNLDSWHSIKSGYGITIYKIPIAEELKYELNIENKTGRLIYHDYFKTKSQALKFAKAYMRKN